MWYFFDLVESIKYDFVCIVKFTNLGWILRNTNVHYMRSYFSAGQFIISVWLDAVEFYRFKINCM